MSFGHMRLVEKEKLVCRVVGSRDAGPLTRPLSLLRVSPHPCDLSLGLRLGYTNELPFALQLPSTV